MSRYMKATVAITILLLLIAIIINMQMESIKGSASFVEDGISNNMRSAGTVLHVLNSEKDTEFGVMTQETYEGIIYDCGESSEIDSLESNITIARADSLSQCTIRNQAIRFFSQNGVLSGLITRENGEESFKWFVVA